MAGGFKWTDRTLFTRLDNFEPKVQRAIKDTVDYQAARSEVWMKTHAPWSDRTGAARSSLSATTSSRGNQHGRSYGITLSHGMPYGIWLEVRWSGKYGIMPDAIRQGGQDLMRLLDGLFRGIS